MFHAAEFIACQTPVKSGLPSRVRGMASDLGGADCPAPFAARVSAGRPTTSKAMKRHAPRTAVHRIARAGAIAGVAFRRRLPAAFVGAGFLRFRSTIRSRRAQEEVAPIGEGDLSAVHGRGAVLGEKAFDDDVGAGN